MYLIFLFFAISNSGFFMMVFFFLCIFSLMLVLLKNAIFLNNLIILEISAMLALVGIMFIMSLSSCLIFSLITFFVCESVVGLSVLVKYSRMGAEFNSNL